MPARLMTQNEYISKFCGEMTVNNALRVAQENRRFEIELYWKRAAYFWTFIGATFVGYFTIQSSGATNRADLAVLLACLGLVFSFAWYCVNRGSKRWQENWEKHVDMLEDSVTGPLYKTVLSRNDPQSTYDKVSGIITGPASLSVSKINQMISFYVFVMWVLLLWYSLPAFNVNAKIHWLYTAIVSISIMSCLSFLILCRSYEGGYWHKAIIRTSRIRPTDEEVNTSDVKGDLTP